MGRNFYDEAESLVLDALEAVSLINSDVCLDPATKTVWLQQRNADWVALLSGGGAGHEPAHAGYVGDGMLTAAVSGSVFASPSVTQILFGITRIAGPAGVLLINKNYTGDVFHFHLAAEKARFKLGIEVEVLTVGDDVSVGRRKSGKVGRRGLAGTVLVHKILGAYSRESGATLAKVKELGNKIVQNLVTTGVSLEHVKVPGRDTVNATASDQVELGMGIHNEPGCQLLSPRPPLSELIDTMLKQLLDMDDEDRSYVDFFDSNVVVMVNNLGGISPIELGGITAKVVRGLATRNVLPTMILSGTYMTSLNGPGFSITLLKANPEMINYLGNPTAAPAWSHIRSRNLKTQPGVEFSSQLHPEEGALGPVEYSTTAGISFEVEAFKRIITQSCQNLMDSELLITKNDSLVGDGDCGVTLARGAKAVINHLKSPVDGSNVAKAILDLVDIIETQMDGTSGAIYGIFFAALAAELRSMRTDSMTPAAWAAATSGALRKLQQATPARQGDRTLMDALEPFVEKLAQGASLTEAVSAARKGMGLTKGMKATLGRAVYVEDSAWDLVPDPGAQGVVCILEGLESSI